MYPYQNVEKSDNQYNTILSQLQNKNIPEMSHTVMIWHQALGYILKKYMTLKRRVWAEKIESVPNLKKTVL